MCVQGQILPSQINGVVGDGRSLMKQDMVPEAAEAVDEAPEDYALMTEFFLWVLKMIPLL